MFILSFFTDLMSSKALSGRISEPLAVIFFGIVLFGITAGLRSILNKQDENTKAMLGEMKEAVVINKN
jgi:hypothetical protein